MPFKMYPPFWAFRCSSLDVVETSSATHMACSHQERDLAAELCLNCVPMLVSRIINYIPSFFKVTFWFPKWRSRFQPWKGHPWFQTRSRLEEHGLNMFYADMSQPLQGLVQLVWWSVAEVSEFPKESNGSVSLEILYLGKWEFTNLDDEILEIPSTYKILFRILKGDIQNFSSVKFDHDFLQCFLCSPNSITMVPIELADHASSHLHETIHICWDPWHLQHPVPSLQRWRRHMPTQSDAATPWNRNRWKFFKKMARKHGK